MAEGLSRTIKAAITDHSLSGLSLHIISPPISHSQFVDDILMMGLPTVREATRILSVINLFCDASGMDVNLPSPRSSSSTCPSRCKSTSLSSWGSPSSLPSNYLGIPLIDNPLRNISWEDLLSKFRKRLSSWNFCSLNIPGHLILLKFVLQDLPVYAFSALAAPSFILTIIRNIQRNFLWKGAKDGHKRALVSWKKKCQTKAHRGTWS
jgi:hypothetical protein